MRPQPPEHLTDLAERLGLATEDQVRAVAGRVRRLARQLPLFESVWVDAMAQARILTQLQAAEINAGRADALRVGPYVLCRRLPSPGYFDSYQAREVESGRTVRLAVFRLPPQPSGHAAKQLQELVAASAPIHSERLAPITQAEVSDCLGWAACRPCGHRTVADWISHNGRFLPDVALEIARQMLVGLVELEKAGSCHGDLSAVGLAWAEDAGLLMPHPGLRGILRPAEGYASADLPPENYDYLAPERITGGGPPTVVGDVYSCGCLWWHLLTGRPPVPGGDGLAKLRGHLTGQIPDVRQIAPETTGRFAAAIAASVRRDPAARPQSMAEVSKMLAAATRTGHADLARCMARGNARATRFNQSVRAIRRSQRTPLWVAGIAGCLVAGVAVIWHASGFSFFDPAAKPRAEKAEQAERFQRSQNTGDPELASSSRSESASPIPGQPTPDTPSLPVAPPPALGDGPENDLVLEAGQPISLDSIDFKAQQRIRGLPGQRPLVMVPPTGLVLSAENVRFEKIDFVWEPATSSLPATDRAALIHLKASRAEFTGCSFQAADAASAFPVAIRWTHPAHRGQLDLPSGEVRLEGCLFRRVDAAVASETLGAISLEFDNVLHLGRGPLVRLDHSPAADESVGVGLSNVTLRDSGPLVECRSGQVKSRGGNISVRSNGCAFVTTSGVALLSFTGTDSPQALLDAVYWTGQGSLVSPETAIAAWQPPRGPTEVLDDAGVSIAGLVRGRVEFAGPLSAGPQASRIVEWQAPLLSSDPPGADPKNLSWPGR
jgi:serine/threonine protein kinase